jgi:cytochrome c peroxidase
VGLALALGLAGLGAAPSRADDAAALRERARALFGALPKVAESPANPSTGPRVKLGQVLYHDPRLSKGQQISCNSCHLLDRYGVDGEPTSKGHKGQRGARNAPTVYNAALHFAQFWDGRAKDVEEQAKGPVTNPVEMGMPTPPEVDAVLRSIPGYAPLFAAAFPGKADPVSFDDAALAIAAFERTLVTPAPFDAFLAGDDAALDAAQRRGLATFLETGCPTCHVGAAVGGGMFQKLGLVHPYETKDPGRFAVTKNEADRGFFKVPSLRNVAKTGPWFHDGSIQTLDEAVKKMAWHQLGKELTPEQTADVVAFLGSLTAPLKPEWTAEPELPPSGPKTPAPRLD